MDYNIHQIYYDERTKKGLNDAFTPYYNPNCSDIFENQVIIDLIDKGEHKKAKYFGVVSWKFKIKTMHDGSILKEIKGVEDVYSFFSKWNNRNFLNLMEEWHKGSVEALKVCLQEAGLPVIDRVNDVNLYNFQIAKSEIYEDYVNEWLKPIVYAMYNSSRAKEALSKVKTTGKYQKYPPHPFILERLFSLYCIYNKIRIKQIPKIYKHAKQVI